MIGDKILKHIADLVKHRLRKSDIFARLGGEEFIILLPDTSLEESYQVAEMLRATIDTETFERVGKVTCSFGITILKEDESADTLLKRVDDLLYQAKEDGRNRIVHQ